MLFADQPLHGTRFHDNAAQVRLVFEDEDSRESSLCHVPWDTFRGQPGPTWEELASKFVALGTNVGLEHRALRRLSEAIAGLEQATSMQRMLGALRSLMA